MDASREEVEQYLNKGTRTKGEAQRIVDELIHLKTLVEEADSPMLVHLRESLEGSMKFHGRAALDNIKVQEQFALTCPCGMKHDLNKAYYHVYQDAWKTIASVVTKWTQKNANIIKAARR